MPETDSSELKRKQRKNLDFYHSPTQMRFDTWNRLEEYVNRLNQKQMRKADVAALTKKTRDAITLLETFESYCAFPSEEDFSLLWQLFDQQNFALLSNVVSRIVRALTGGTYRSRHINLRVAAELEDRMRRHIITKNRARSALISKCCLSMKVRTKMCVICVSACVNCAARKISSSTTLSRCRVLRMR